jgi:hypothetical protein
MRMKLFMNMFNILFPSPLSDLGNKLETTNTEQDLDMIRK